MNVTATFGHNLGNPQKKKKKKKMQVKIGKTFFFQQSYVLIL